MEVGMTDVPGTIVMRLAVFVLAISVSGCSVIGFVGGTGVDALSRHPRVPVSPDSLFALRDGARLALTLLDSTRVEGKKLASSPSDYDSTGSLTVLRFLKTVDSEYPAGDSMVVRISQVAIATVPAQRTAARRAAAAGAKPDIVALKVLVGLALTAALLVGIFGLVLTNSHFSF
jgi:hypothetical protein